MESLRDTQRERLFYIEFLALFTGQVRRKDLVARFGISEPAATKDFSSYVEIAPKVIEYDLRKKCYVYTNGKTLFKHDINQALFSLAGERAIAIDSNHAKRLPSWIDSSIKRNLSLKTVSTITRCIFQHSKMETDYVSLSSGSQTRELSPMTIVHDGLRWHVRCYDYKNNEYRDYNLTRFKSAKETDSSNILLDDDTEWNKEVTIQLVPHPKSEHPETIIMDYDIKKNIKSIKLKICLIGYFLRQWNIDFSDDATGNPRAKQLFLNNKSELLNKGVSEWAFEE